MKRKKGCRRSIFCRSKDLIFFYNLIVTLFCARSFDGIVGTLYQGRSIAAVDIRMHGSLPFVGRLAGTRSLFYLFTAHILLFNQWWEVRGGVRVGWG